MIITVPRLSSEPSSSTSAAPRRPSPSALRLTSSTHAQRRAAALERQPPITFAPRGPTSTTSSTRRGGEVVRPATIKGGTEKSLWQSWISLPPTTRMLIGVAFAVTAVTGMMITKQVQFLTPAPKRRPDANSSDTPREPRLFGITVVDRKPEVQTPLADDSAGQLRPSSATSIAFVGLMLLPMAARSKPRKHVWASARIWRSTACREGATIDTVKGLSSTCRTSASQSKSRSPPPLYLSRAFWPIPSKVSSSDIIPSDVDSSPGSADESLSMLIRGGYIRQSSSGIFTFLSPGLELLRSIELIVSEEMDSIHASRIEMPTLLSNKLWKKSGRDESMGSELYRLKDRKGGGFVLGPTYEEEVTKLVGGEVHSYKQLPVKVYQITRKHRDEPRPRLGLLRTREFVMKDMYTFDASTEDAQTSYKDVQGAYQRIMNRLFHDGSMEQSSAWRMAQADSGAMGGILSHEYHVEDPAGEDDLLICSSCSYTANSELATSRAPRDVMPLVSTDVSVRLYSLSNDPVNAGPLFALVSPHNSPINEVKVASVLRSAATAAITASGSRPSPASRSADTALQVYPIRKGEVHWDWKDRPEGPAVRFQSLQILADPACSSLAPEDIIEAVERALFAYCDPSGQAPSSFQTEGSTPQLADFFPSSLSRQDFLSYKDLQLAQAGSRCASCTSGTLSQSKSIEVGHTFLLGTRYSESLGYQFASKPEIDATTGKQLQQDRKFFQMGCYGIGITRLMGVLAMKARKDFLALQQQRDQNTDGVEVKKKKKKGRGDATASKPGFLWPKHLAPYTHAIVLSPSALNASSQSSSTSWQEEIQTLLTRFEDEEAVLATTAAVERLGTRKSPVSVFVDDRLNLSLGAKLTEADLSGAGQVWIVEKGGSRRAR